MRKAGFLGTRWLGVGLAAVLAVVTLGLALTGRLDLYINPESSWFAVSMAVVLLIGAALSFTLPLGAEADHGHDHGGHHEAAELSEQAPTRGRARDSVARHGTAGPGAGGRGAGTRPVAPAATTIGAATASGVVLLTLVLPPASLSAELAVSRDVGAPPLFAGSDAITLAASGDTASFGIGEWATVFATATNPDAFDGDAVTLTGFVTPGDGSASGFDLTRLVITHCVIDAQPASIPVAASDQALETGQWVTISGTVAASSDGRLSIKAATVAPIEEPADPYEY